MSLYYPIPIQSYQTIKEIFGHECARLGVRHAKATRKKKTPQKLETQRGTRGKEESCASCVACMLPFVFWFFFFLLYLLDYPCEIVVYLNLEEKKKKTLHLSNDFINSCCYFAPLDRAREYGQFRTILSYNLVFI